MTIPGLSCAVALTAASRQPVAAIPRIRLTYFMTGNAPCSRLSKCGSAPELTRGKMHRENGDAGPLHSSLARGTKRVPDQTGGILDRPQRSAIKFDMVATAGRWRRWRGWTFREATANECLMTNV